jgi:2-polyprenyl-6-methoxyphenol hydroxylase-like FAD-dependent oxidoreductase
MSDTTYDAVVVGARCAGAPTAMLLARSGHRVLLLDRARFPSDTLSTHWIHQPGVALLRRWGLLRNVVESGCPPIDKVTLDFGPLSLSGSPLAADGIVSSYAPRRMVLDQILVEAAVEAGAELREEFVVDELLRDEQQVTGIRGHSRKGGTISERAHIVVGADGLHSTVARLVSAPVYRDRGVLAASYYTYWSGVPTDGVEVYVRDRRSWGMLPTHDGLTVLPLSWPRAEFEANRRDVERNYLAALDQAPEVAERVQAGRREDRFRGSGELGNFFRKPYGRGWALVGDAAMHKDPCTAQGITDAFQDAEMVAAAVHAGLSGEATMEAGLQRYEERRDRDRMGIFEFTCQLASLEPPPPEMLHLLGAIHRDRAASNRFVSLIAGTESFESFFAAANLAAMTG